MGSVVILCLLVGSYEAGASKVSLGHYVAVLGVLGLVEASAKVASDLSKRISPALLVLFDKVLLHRSF